MMQRFLAVVVVVPGLAFAQACPEKHLNYWQAFPAGGESDISARHQQLVLKKRCPAIETIIQYKPGAGGGLMWTQMNQLPADGLNIVGINLPHIVLQPLEGQVQYRTDKAGIVQCTIGRASFTVEALEENLKALVDAVNKARPQGAKGVYLKKIAVSSTMGAGVRVDQAGFGGAQAH